MKNSKEWNNGWNNCFCSFCNEICYNAEDKYNILRSVINGAGLTKKEIKDIIKEQPMTEESVYTLNILISEFKSQKWFNK